MKIMAWAISVNTIIAGGVAGVNTLTIDPLAAASVFLKVGRGLPELLVSMSSNRPNSVSGLKLFYGS